MIAHLKRYKQLDPSAKSLAEVFFLYPGPKAIFFYKLSHFFYKLKLYFLARLISETARLLTGIEIHPGAQIGKNLVIDHGMGVVIGETAVVGDNCMLYHSVTLGGVSQEGQSKRHPTLGDEVIVGAGAKILGDVLMASKVKIGAGAVVTKSCATEGATLVGIPAQELGKS